VSRRDFLEDFVDSSLWSTVPAKYLFRYKKDPNTGMKETHRLALTMGGVVDRSLEDTDGLQSSDYATYQIFEKGDLAFKLIDLQNIKTSRVGLVPRRGIMSSAYIRLVPNKEDILPEFYYWYFYAAYLGNIFNGLGGGIRQSLNQTELLEFPVPQISRDDQAVIIEHLKSETTRIDGLIEKKARFIALLKEKLWDAADVMVTGRDDPNRDLQSVDIPWAPQIPREWTTKRAKFLFQEMSRAVCPGDDIITAFRDGQVCLRSKRRTEGYTFAELEVGYQHICKGDLVIHTMDAFAGAIGISEDDGKATGEYAVCAPRSADVNSEYYAYLLRCMARRQYIYILCPSVRERAPRFRFFRFAPVLLPLPPRAEQDQIVRRIKKTSARLKNLITKTERSIDLLKEKRAAVITAAVTGKIDVRNAE